MVYIPTLGAMKPAPKMGHPLSLPGFERTSNSNGNDTQQRKISTEWRGMMETNVQEQVQTFEIVKDEEILAPIGIVFEAILEQMGPMNSVPDRGPMPMVLEAWPGGRWFRDLGNGAGHYWGTVQAMKAPTLLEICGPLFMSTPAISNLQYRLSEENGVTRIKFVHRAMGWMETAHLDGVNTGWTDLITRIRTAAEKKGGKI